MLWRHRNLSDFGLVSIMCAVCWLELSCEQDTLPCATQSYGGDVYRCMSSAEGCQFTD